MDARTQRTLYRLLATLAVLGVALVIVLFVKNDELRVLGIGLATAAIFSLEQFLKSSGDNAAPTVAAVNLALEEGAAVPPPKIAVATHPLTAAIQEATIQTPSD